MLQAGCCSLAAFHSAVHTQTVAFGWGQHGACLRRGRCTDKSCSHAEQPPLAAAMSEKLLRAASVCIALLYADYCHTLPVTQAALLQAAPHCAQPACSCRTCSPALQGVCIMRQGCGRRPLHRRAWRQDALLGPGCMVTAAPGHACSPCSEARVSSKAKGCSAGVSRMQ